MVLCLNISESLFKNSIHFHTFKDDLSNIQITFNFRVCVDKLIEGVAEISLSAQTRN